MATGVPAPPIITCSQWGARRPRSTPRVIHPAPRLVVIHHTAGHAPKGATGFERAVLYARAIQALHMGPGGLGTVDGAIDSGHNFLVMRSGHICQGRWGTVSAIEAGKMVESAHCPGENDQPGIEHEHVSGELMTAEQIAASSWLLAWICSRTGRRPTQFYPHGDFYNTACPDVVKHDIPTLRLKAAGLLTRYGHGGGTRRNRLRVSIGGGRMVMV